MARRSTKRFWQLFVSLSTVFPDAELLCHCLRSSVCICNIDGLTTTVYNCISGHDIQTGFTEGMSLVQLGGEHSLQKWQGSGW